MPAITLDWSDAEGSGFEPLPSGTYTAQVEDIKVGESRSGNPKLEFTYSLIDAEFKNRKIWDSKPLIKAGMGITLKYLMGLGMTGQEIMGQTTPASLVTELRKRFLGAQVEMHVTKGVIIGADGKPDPEGKEGNNITSVRATGGPAAAAVGKQGQSLQELFGA